MSILIFAYISEITLYTLSFWNKAQPNGDIHLNVKNQIENTLSSFLGAAAGTGPSG